MKNELEKEIKNSKNRFELEGNVANINELYINKNGRKILRFDLGQNNNKNTQFLPIVLKGELAEVYNNEIQKGDWVSIKGKISTYQKTTEKDGKTYKDKVIEILGFEITDRTKNKVYTSDGQVRELVNNNEEMER